MRVIDTLSALIGLLLLSPLFALIAIAIKVDSPGPVFHRARRVGKDGVLFQLYKFRSMVTDADKRGPGITAAGDARITRVGRFLRRTKIDELPQLINVLKGDMSLVGPRPEDPRYVALYTPEQRRVLAVRPGITSAASLAYRHEEQLLFGPDWETIYRTQVMPAKLALDLAYLERRTFISDLKLILRTIIAIFDQERENIESRPLWKPMHLQPVFRGCEVVGGAVAEALFRDGLCLPSGTAMTGADIERVVGVIRSCRR